MAKKEKVVDREPTTEEIFTAVFIAAALIGGKADLNHVSFLAASGRALAQTVLKSPPDDE